MLFTGIGGVLYAWLRIKTGSVWPSIICHSIWNLFAGVIIFL
ncbi:MAG: type II CAAX prenyl endopeptidase Rce1 family protein [Candidatus Thalassarchaeaceae archaeon]